MEQKFTRIDQNKLIHAVEVPVNPRFPNYGTKIQRMRNIVIEWADVKHRVMASLERREPWMSQPAMRSHLGELAQHPYERNSWHGGSGADVLKGLREGYRAEEFRNSAERVPSALQHRATWSEEDGDIDVGRLYGGHDEFMLGMAERPSKPGIRVQVEYAFACGVSNSVIAEYGAFVAGLLGAMEQYGFDMVVDMWIPLDNLYRGDRDIRSNVLVRVKKANEVADFTEWSALFAPYGYRVLGFSAKCVAGDKIGLAANGTLGTTIGGKTWGLEYDPEEATVTITVNQRAGGSERFPKATLIKQAIEAKLIPDPDAFNA